MKIPHYHTDCIFTEDQIAQHDEDLLDTAAHEAGHWVMALLARSATPAWATIVPCSLFSGYIHGVGVSAKWAHWEKSHGRDPSRAIRISTLATIAGAVAQAYSGTGTTELGLGLDYVNGAEQDAECATDALELIGIDWAAVEGDYLYLVHDLLKYRRPRRALRLVANALLEHGTVAGSDCDHLNKQVLRTLGSYRHGAYQRIERWVDMPASAAA